MMAFGVSPVALPADSDKSASTAYRALAESSQSYLRCLDEAVVAGSLLPHTALMTRVRGTGPGVAFGSVVRALESFPHSWESPFENSRNVSGAVIRGCDILGEGREDGFLLLRFEAGTKDLPLHLHADSDRFIFAIGGRGFFHVSPDPLGVRGIRRIRHVPVKDRDALMFRRGTVHTFSTAEHPLLLLSYHQPFVPLEEENQYTPANPPEFPRDFLNGCDSRVSFDPAWSVLTSDELMV